MITFFKKTQTKYNNNDIGKFYKTCVDFVNLYIMLSKLYPDLFF